jgi:hypothetical protein
MAMQRPKKTPPRTPAREAQREAEKDIEMDPEFKGGDPTDDLDEGELARRDNSEEDGFDALEKQRPRGGAGHPRKGSAK